MNLFNFHNYCCICDSILLCDHISLKAAAGLGDVTLKRIGIELD